jgi:hypothetical protein
VGETSAAGFTLTAQSHGCFASSYNIPGPHAGWMMGTATRCSTCTQVKTDDAKTGWSGEFCTPIDVPLLLPNHHLHTLPPDCVSCPTGAKLVVTNVRGVKSGWWCVSPLPSVFSTGHSDLPPSLPSNTFSGALYAGNGVSQGACKSATSSHLSWVKCTSCDNDHTLHVYGTYGVGYCLKIPTTVHERIQTSWPSRPNTKGIGIFDSCNTECAPMDNLLANHAVCTKAPPAPGCPLLLLGWGLSAPM